MIDERIKKLAQTGATLLGAFSILPLIVKKPKPPAVVTTTTAQAPTVTSVKVVTAPEKITPQPIEMPVTPQPQPQPPPPKPTPEIPEVTYTGEDAVRHCAININPLLGDTSLLDAFISYLKEKGLIDQYVCKCKCTRWIEVAGKRDCVGWQCVTVSAAPVSIRCFDLHYESFCCSYEPLTKREIEFWGLVGECWIYIDGRPDRIFWKMTRADWEAKGYKFTGSTMPAG